MFAGWFSPWFYFVFPVVCRGFYLFSPGLLWFAVFFEIIEIFVKDFIHFFGVFLHVKCPK